MIIIIGLIILVAALVVGVAGVLGNGGSAHVLTHFSVLGYHVTGSAGTLFLDGIVVGAAGLLGLSFLLAGARRTARRGRAARRGLRQSRRETAAVSRERDDLVDQRDTARADTASTPDNGTAPQVLPLSPNVDRWSRLRALRQRSEPVQAAATHSDSSAGEQATGARAPARRAADLPARVAAPAE
jgi:hypothetical protein